MWFYVNKNGILDTNKVDFRQIDRVKLKIEQSLNHFVNKSHKNWVIWFIGNK